MNAKQKQYFPKWLLYALLCILSWGVWGGLTKVGADKMTPAQMQVLFTLGMVPVVLAALIQLRWKVDRDRFGATYGILNGVLGLLAFYAAMARGKASIVGPVTALFPLLTVMLALLLLKERMNRVQTAGVFVALASIFILSR